jgi:hypothetical protein
MPRHKTKYKLRDKDFSAKDHEAVIRLTHVNTITGAALTLSSLGMYSQPAAAVADSAATNAFTSDNNTASQFVFMDHNADFYHGSCLCSLIQDINQ